MSRLLPLVVLAACTGTPAPEPTATPTPTEAPPVVAAEPEPAVPAPPADVRVADPALMPLRAIYARLAIPDPEDAQWQKDRDAVRAELDAGLTTDMIIDKAMAAASAQPPGTPVSALLGR